LQVGALLTHNAVELAQSGLLLNHGGLELRALLLLPRNFCLCRRECTAQRVCVCLVSDREIQRPRGRHQHTFRLSLHATEIAFQGCILDVNSSQAVGQLRSLLLELQRALDQDP
jgi:hypothetical protein